MQKKNGYKNIISLIIAALLFFAPQAESSKLHQEDGIMSNHSTEFVRTLNRNTSTDPDAAFYNPAGLAFMDKNGLHLSFSSQTYYVKKTHSTDLYALKVGSDPVATPPHKQSWFRGISPDEYSAELLAPVLPGFDIAWKQNDWAGFFSIAVMQAAVDMTYSNGIGEMDWGCMLNNTTTFIPSTQNLELYSRNALAVRNEMYIGLTIGGAYQFLNWLSAGGGLRLIHASGNMKIDMTDINFVSLDDLDGPGGNEPERNIKKMEDWKIDTDTSGMGYGIILSTHFRADGLISALKGFETSLRYEYYPPMELKKKTNSFYCEETLEASGNLDIFKDGSPSPLMEYRSENGNGKDKLKVTYPSTVNLGLSYLISGWIKVLSSSQISFRNRRDLDGREKDYKPGYQAGLGIEFILNPAVTLSTGYLYNNFGIKPSERSEADPLLNSHQLGGGARLKITENLDLNLGAFYQYFIPATAYSVKFVHVSEPTYSYLKKDFKETRISISIGATYRLFGGEAASAKPKAEETSTPVNIEKNNNDKTVKNSPVKSVKGIKKINRPNTKI